MAEAPFSQVMEREAKQGPVATGKLACGGPKALVQSQNEAEAFGQRFWTQYEKNSKWKSRDGVIYFEAERMYKEMLEGHDGSPAPVRLLRLSWLLEKARRRAVLPRRQELPEEAFLSEAEVRALPRGHVGRACETWVSILIPGRSPNLIGATWRRANAAAAHEVLERTEQKQQ